MEHTREAGGLPLTTHGTRAGKHALSMLAPATSGTDPATPTLPSHKIVAELQLMRARVGKHPGVNGGRSVTTVTINSLRGAGAHRASHSGMPLPPLPGARAASAIQEAFIGLAKVFTEKDIPTKRMSTTVESSSLGHKLTNTIRIEMKLARRLGQPLLLRNMFEAALQAGDLPSLFPIALGSAALRAKDSTGVNGPKHMTFCINTRRRGNVPRRRSTHEEAACRECENEAKEPGTGHAFAQCIPARHQPGGSES